MSPASLRARHYRTVWISDVHLGFSGCQADFLLDFLHHVTCDRLYLVGDIIDGWALKSNWHWPQSHNDFVQKMLRRVRKGAKVIYIPGNHDEFLRSYYGTHFGGVEVVETAIHEGADGKKYLVIHGDIFDLVVQNARLARASRRSGLRFRDPDEPSGQRFRKLFGRRTGRCRNGRS
jgi:UDP-2,3-diacylglucosamine pyrophosphatase LpxH